MSLRPMSQPASFSASQPEGFSLEESAALVTMATPRLTKYVTQTPTEPQLEFLLDSSREVLYGGAAGGGKSSALLMAALQYVDVPGYSAIIFRRTYADLSKPGALMDRSREWLSNTDAVFNEQKHMWRFPSGATLSFGHLDTERDKYDYQGAEFQFIGWDELTQFKESQYRYLYSRRRRLKKQPVPLRMRATSNPGGEGHDWVHRRFFTETKPGRAFIPAKLEDNPHLDIASYEESLAELDPVTRRQLRHGDWSAREAGEYFKREWFNVLGHAPLASGRRRVRYWDFAATEASKKSGDPDWCVGTLQSERAGEYVIEDVVRFRKAPAATEAEVVRVAELDGVGVEQHFEQEPGASSKILIAHLQRSVLKGHAVYGHTSSKDKVTRSKPFSAACEQGRVSLVRADWNSGWLDRLEAFPTKGVKDDEVDSASGGFNELHKRGPGVPIPPLRPAVRTGLSGMEM